MHSWLHSMSTILCVHVFFKGCVQVVPRSTDNQWQLTVDANGVVTDAEDGFALHDKVYTDAACTAVRTGTIIQGSASPIQLYRRSVGTLYDSCTIGMINESK